MSGSGHGPREGASVEALEPRGTVNDGLLGRIWMWYMLAGTAMGAAAFYGWVSAMLAPVSSLERPQTFVVQKGEPLKRITRELEDQGLVRSAWTAEWYARLHGLGKGLRAGEYDLTPSYSVAQLLAHLSTGQVKTYEVVLPEGWNAREMAARLDAAGLVDAAAFVAYAEDPASAEALGVEGPGLEGYLFPETYRLPHGLSAREVAKVLVGHFLEVWRELEPAAKAQGMSMREVVTLASIVEKETGAPEERPLIASVFHNRLARGMKLESDPTIIYGLPDFDGNLRRRDLEDESNPYNTYQIPALPPGPIANPGAAALRAVVDPAESKYLFFVSRNDGTHVFARTFAEHERNVDCFQRRKCR